MSRLDTSRFAAEIHRYVAAHGIDIGWRGLARDMPARFNGRTIELNAAFDLSSVSFYLLHSLGSIVGWSLDRDRVQAVFDELREAKAVRSREPERLERALVPFREFETVSSEYSVWALEALQLTGHVEEFSEFFRADLEAITIFHRTDVMPVWRTFFDDWRREVAAGIRCFEPFAARPIPTFTPVRFDWQEVQQRR